MDTVKIAIAQINSCVGDISGNAAKVLSSADSACNDGVDLLLTPELVITGYPPEDLLFNIDFIENQNIALNNLINESRKFKELYLLIGHVSLISNSLYNSASLIYQGNLILTYYKCALPNYSIFDEKRYFSNGNRPSTFSIRGISIGIMICEDLWSDDVIKMYNGISIDVLTVLNASPFNVGKDDKRIAIAKKSAKELNCDVVYANSVGGQDDLVFDGSSFIINRTGNYLRKLHSWREDYGYYEVGITKDISYIKNDSEESQLWSALVLGLRDYVYKNRFPGVLLGLSGGIDSALALSIAVDAIGFDKVSAIMMPSFYTSDISIEDSSSLASNLKIDYRIINIDDIVLSFIKALCLIQPDNLIEERENSTYENIQARIRGVLLMAISNSSGKLVLNTSNKSEISVGYCTLYGDAIGGFSVLKDISKGMVYRLARWYNRDKGIIPERIISRAPSAELRPNQTDQDSLPPYDLLDKILMLHIEKGKTKKEIIDSGYSRDIVLEVFNLLRSSEYKRYQSPPGTRVSERSFGKDWRYPITNNFNE
ncbi:glutamine-hydrolysing NAD+ synthase [Candidatus Kinetoplastibacterium blastocrithidii TCC012E]|uniref:Glutamine-dependent NAD(+) synthetase n=1 Tax=Candidatus Kinetoplastidibacterium blastocrithidiae TCC012E TaxID=1208922 RepID=M1M0C9_9PROT|nr:NAD+ synthase [Candidatus Kinetoplastibacterium blastocrithidii]AFZ83615.1 NAD synthetase [Candidatus Kinetoplastibacterium blastocrithidii (ex Strigomonas culicis)]AGF49736.1 glutamine-hydrolysing NAD+ synthase [Candidatus Kinetoplastibacterium blastocrithidii TCC012E]